MKGSASYQKDMLLPTRHSSKCGVKEGSSTVLGVCSEQNHCLFYIFTAPGSSLVPPFEAPATLCFIEVKMCQTEAVTYETLPWFMADCCRAGMQMGHLLCHLCKITLMSGLLRSQMVFQYLMDLFLQLQVEDMAA